MNDMSPLSAVLRDAIRTTAGLGAGYLIAQGVAPEIANNVADQAATFFTGLIVILTSGTLAYIGKRGRNSGKRIPF